MPRKKADENTDILQPITEQQQRFIEALLAGKNITEASIATGISRRAATYWIHSEHPVRWEYEKQRLNLIEQFRARIANLHELALKAMEESLSESAPPAVRFQAAKYLYETHLQHISGVRQPLTSEKLVEKEVQSVKDASYFHQFDENYMRLIPE